MFKHGRKQCLQADAKQDTSRTVSTDASTCTYVTERTNEEVTHLGSSLTFVNAREKRRKYA